LERWSDGLGRDFSTGIIASLELGKIWGVGFQKIFTEWCIHPVDCLRDVK